MKFKYIILTGLLFAFFSSCSEDFLEVPSKADLTSAVYYKTQADFTAAVNGIYSPSRAFSMQDRAEGAIQIMMPALCFRSAICIPTTDGICIILITGL
jgi:hypothetical protein